MNSTSNNRTKEIELDLVDLMWRLLGQWKTVLIAGIIGAVLCSSLVYVRDTRTYKEQVAAAKEEVQSLDDIEGQIESALDALPDSDKPIVQQSLRRSDKINEMTAYISDSAIMNIDANSAHILSIGYVISDVESDRQLEALNAGCICRSV